MMARTKPQRDEQREQRIRNEIVVDAHGAQERAMGWYYYLDDTIQFPFTATCVEKRAISPLRVKDKVEVLKLADESECEREIFAVMRWQDDELAVPLSQLQPTARTDDETKEAVADWHYWVKMGYEF